MLPNNSAIPFPAIDSNESLFYDRTSWTSMFIAELIIVLVD